MSLKPKLRVWLLLNSISKVDFDCWFKGQNWPKWNNMQMIPWSDSWYQVFPSYLTGMEGGGGGWGCGNRRKLHHFTPLLRIVSWMVLGFDANTSETNLSIYIDRQQFSHCCLSCQRGVSKDVGSLFIWLKIMSRCVSSFCRIWWMNEKKKSVKINLEDIKTVFTSQRAA